MKVYVDAKELLAAAKFCDDKKNKGCREILRCVHVESNENDYALVSTDSYKLIKFVHNNTNPDGTNDVFTCNIGIDIIKESVKTTDDVICIEYDEETLAVTLDIFKKNRFNIVNRASVKTTANNSTYPQYNKLLEKDVKRDDDGNELPKMNGIRLNTAFVEETCKYIQLAYGKKPPLTLSWVTLMNRRCLTLLAKWNITMMVRAFPLVIAMDWLCLSASNTPLELIRTAVMAVLFFYLV